MKNLAKVIIVLGALSFASNVAAEEEVYPMQGKYLWSLGFDALYLQSKPVGEFNRVLNNSKFGSTIYAASRFQSPFGYEVGYTWTEPKGKGLYAPIGTTVFGSTATAAQTHDIRFKLKQTYLDLNAHLPLGKFVEAKLALGLGFVRTSIVFRHNPGNTVDPLQATLDRISGSTAITARVGVGAQALISERFGIRAMFMYQTMSQAKVRGMPNGYRDRPLSNSYTASLGMFFTLAAHRERDTY